MNNKAQSTSVRSARRFRLRVGDSMAVLLLAAAVQLTPHANASEPAPITLDQAFAIPGITGIVPTNPVWSPDSRRFAFAWNHSGTSERALWIAAKDGKDLRRVDTDADAGSVRGIAWLPDGNTILTLRGEALWATDVRRGRTSQLAEIGPGASNLTVSPDGSKAAWLKGGDLWLVNVGGGTPVAATDIGIASLSSLPLGRYSRPEREIGPGIWGGPTYEWSPNGKTIAVHYVDRRGMRKVPFPDYLADETNPNEVRRGYPGDPNELRTVGLVDVERRELELLDLDDPTANQVVGFSWSPDGVLLLDLATDTAVDRWLTTLDPANSAEREIWRSSRDSRIYTAFASSWQPDGEHVVFLSDREDRYGLYSINAASGSLRRLTDAAWDVLSAPKVNAARGMVFFEANGVNPYEQHVYRVSLDGGEAVRITNRPGRHTGFPSPDGRSVAVIHSDDANPPEIYVVSADGGEMQRVTTSPLPAFREHEWAQARYVSFPSEIDDYVLHARILEPPDLDPSRLYPVLFGPAYSNTARNRWRGTYSMAQQLLVKRGYIVVQVDVRGSTGYGRAFREEFLLDFAGEDIEDLASAVKYMKTLPYVDPDRFGIWGSSYGGTLSVYTLLKKPGLFQAAVAAASAVDPYFFGTDDVAIVRRPDTDPEIYENAARYYADNLEDHLLFIHGMQDHVVPFKTVAVLADELIRKGKNFDFALAPGATHAWRSEPYYARFLYGKLFEYFDRHLGESQPESDRKADSKETHNRD